MLIKIISVEVNEVPGKKYKQVEVAYKSDKGETKGKKLMDFSVKNGLKILLNAKAGDMLEVTPVKNGEYWNWETIAVAGDSPAAPASSSGGSKPTTYAGRDFETKEERAARQVMIVRQSSISSAVSLLKTEKNVPSIDDILKAAKAFEEFVMGTTIITKPADVEVSIGDMEDDIPY